MKNRYIKIFVIGCLAILFYNGCKPKDCHDDGTCAEDYRRMPLGEAKNYLYALPGSYWIYKNTLTGDLDTQTCTGFICDTIISKGEDLAKYITIEYERIRKTSFSSFNHLEYYDETRGYNASAPRDLETIFNRWSGGNNIQPFFHPFIINTNTGNGASTTTCKGLDSALIIQGKLYKNVAIFNIDLDGVVEINCKHPAIVTTYYWSKDVGLVKKTIKDCNYSWELIEHKIIK